MEYRYLGNTGIKVSELCFGTMSFGGDADKKTSYDMYNRCREKGVNFFDCANVYQKGRAEEFLGEFTREERKKLIISTKAFFPIDDDVNSRGASRKHLFDSLHDSLKRLKTDYIDFFYIHHFDENTDIEETMRALGDMVRQGKILYPAASNFAAWQLMKANGFASSGGLSPFKCIQPMYNLLKRQAEVELFPMAISEKLGVTSYSPLGGGLLTGKFRRNKRPDQGRMVSNEMYKKRYGAERNMNAVEKFVSYAESLGLNPVSLAVRWVSTHRALTAPIIGARNVNQLNDSLNSVDIDMSEEMRNIISSFSEEPAPPTDRSEEKTDLNYTEALKK